MQEVCVTAYGGRDVLTLRACDVNVDECVLGDDDVLVRNTYAGVNFIDTYFRTGLYKKPSLPFVLGAEGVGVVVKTGGSALAAALRGRRVAHYNGSGSYSPYTIVAASSAFVVPDAVRDDRLAVAALVQGLTAHYLSHDCYVCTSQSTVLVHAAAGGTGLLLCQMAKRRGATVIAVCGGEEKAAMARRVGRADHVVDYRAHASDWPARVRALTPHGAGVDAVYDSVGHDTFAGSLSVLRPRGYFISFGNASGAVPPVAPLTLTAQGSVYLQRPVLQHYIATAEERERRSRDVYGWIADGTLTITIDKVWPLADVAAAHERLESRQTMGKTLLRID